MTDKIESKGKTVQEAVNEALLQMGARKDEVRVEILEEPKTGLFGILGSKQARVLVTRKPPKGQRGGRDHRSQNDDGVAHDLSGGIPRRINNICNLALLLGASRQLDEIDEMVIYDVSRTLEGEY